ncbi:MAG: hypothetical protein GZ090_11415 [Oxalobacteraceae bacterium]|nr:hypothetical protein [Oxalobacteraceae bacterium]
MQASATLPKNVSISIMPTPASGASLNTLSNASFDKLIKPMPTPALTNMLTKPGLSNEKTGLVAAELYQRRLSTSAHSLDGPNMVGGNKPVLDTRIQQLLKELSTGKNAEDQPLKGVEFKDAKNELARLLAKENNQPPSAVALYPRGVVTPTTTNTIG